MNDRSITPVAQTAAARREAHQRIAAHIRQTDPGHADERAAEILDRLIGALRHALAEEIRAQHSFVYEDAGQKTAAGLLRAADLIDSQAQQ